jgi:hypothetical protein
MRFSTIFVLAFLFSSKLLGQKAGYHSADNYFFNRGTELLQTGEFKAADSLLSLALCTSKDVSIFFNRSIARLYQTDTIGFCKDIHIAAFGFFDVEAQNLFNTMCCKRADTVFYNKKMEVTNSSDYRYYEIIRAPKYDTIVYGVFHDLKSEKRTGTVNLTCDSTFLGFIFAKTNAIASYIFEDSIKYYTSTTKWVRIKKVTDYNDLKRRASIYFGVKYAQLKEKQKGENLIVRFKLYINEEGKITKVRFKEFNKVIEFDNIEELEADLLNIANSYPKLTPAMFFKENVCCIALDHIVF